MSNSDTRIDHCVEEICTLGCRAVSAIIRDWESSRPLVVTLLDEARQQRVLDELKSIMAVYDQTGSCALE